MRYSRSKKDGFTLIEVLVVTSILAVLMSALYMSFMTGLAAHKRTEEKLIQKNEGDVFLIQLERELRNAISYFHPDFENYFVGKSSSIAFPAKISHYSSGGAVEDLYLIRYEIKSGSLVRIERKLKENSIGKEENLETLFTNLATFLFEYCSSDELHWEKEWLNQPYVGVPRAVRLTISGDIFGKETKLIEILIHQGVLLKQNNE